MVAVLVCAVTWPFTDAMVLDCEFDIFPFHIVRIVYRCYGNVTLDGKGDDKITAVLGTHLYGQRNVDVEGLIIRSQDIESIPVNIHSFFPALRVLNLPLNSISSVTRKDLSPFPNLEFLALFGNRITSLGSDLFDGMKSLKFINLGRNRIKHVGHNLALPPSAEIYLYSNSCVDRDAVTELEVTYLRFSLIMNCPSSEIPQVDSQSSVTQCSKKKILKDKFLQLSMKVSFSKAFIDGTHCLNVEDPSVYV